MNNLKAIYIGKKKEKTILGKKCIKDFFCGSQVKKFIILSSILIKKWTSRESLR